jgi:phytoene dehydrogenase-like protein
VELASGVFHCRGGVGALVRELAHLARELGVEIVLDRRIERLETAAGRLQRAWTSAGPESADAFVSNLDVITTHQLLGRSTPLERREPSLSGFVLLVGVRGETRGLAHHNIFFPADYPAEFAAIRAGRFPAAPTIHVVLSCRSDRGDAPAGIENWYVMANAPARS